jgi:hypothetical protein
MKKFLTVLFMFAVFTGYAKDDDKKADSIKTLIEVKSFVFVPQSALPLKGGLISLTPSFDVRVSGDTVAAYLPYYGEAKTAIFPGEDAGITFTSTVNKYEVQKTKHGWNVHIKPEDIGNNIELSFSISKSGHVMLRVSDYRRDPITFNGYLKL